MFVSNVMEPFSEGIAPSTRLSDAAVVMRDQKTSILPVIEELKLVGVVTDRDIVIRGVISGRDSNCIPVSEIMTRYIDTVSSGDEVAHAAQRMKESDHQTLIVVDEAGRHIGIVTTEQLLGTPDIIAVVPTM